MSMRALRIPSSRQDSGVHHVLEGDASCAARSGSVHFSRCLWRCARTRGDERRCCGRARATAGAERPSKRTTSSRWSPDRARWRAFAAARESGELIGVITPVVGVSFFTALAEFDGLGLNAAAGRLLGLDETRSQWLGASAWEGGPSWDDEVAGSRSGRVANLGAERLDLVAVDFVEIGRFAGGVRDDGVESRVLLRLRIARRSAQDPIHCKRRTASTGGRADGAG